MPVGRLEYTTRSQDTSKHDLCMGSSGDWISMASIDSMGLDCYTGSALVDRCRDDVDTGPEDVTSSGVA